MRILLVEDDPSVADSVIDGLVSANLEVDHVATGKDAISKALSESFDLILLDLGLPDMDGQDVCRSVREVAHEGRVRVRVCGAGTGWTSEDSRRTKNGVTLLGHWRTSTGHPGPKYEPMEA